MSKKLKSNTAGKAKRTRINQTDIPNTSLEQSLRIAQALWDNFAGKEAAPHNIAMALDLTPTSGFWRNLCGSSSAYGLTEGGYSAKNISLTSLGKRIVAPTVENDDKVALQEAALTPKIPSEFFNQFDRAKFPRPDIAANLLVEKGIPKERSEGAVDLIKENGVFVGFIKETKTGPFVSIDVPLEGGTSSFDGEESDEDFSENLSVVTRENGGAESVAQPFDRSVSSSTDNNRVFITHGKNKEILSQIKEVVELGGFTPVISIQSETAAKPIPEKVMDEMRSCAAAVIHVGSEGVYKDHVGDEHPHINSNVLIEIGAAMALYHGKFILVVEEGVTLPSNLSGMYESRYSGDSIEFKAGMKILKALRGLKAN